jgi:ABC-type multidrug transport system fused ATPase/permease subunit
MYRFWFYLSFEDESLPASWPQYGNVEFRSVFMKHPSQKENFIQDLSLTIPAGQRVSVGVS